ncbi:MFS transporter [Sedimentibacter sp. MB31-C6]|uniref:MFS transporter n=1 Tax=Sedimentibacter sp. MB31-C6 TaxID=3109366 RepID=UPI002DDD2E2D|nr:MFS transporter [Sedimentibacter sp. MB36-C1]WSI03298.1 MFS transporter [Sedimentibacter sp. MB36-C1]
MKINGKKIFLIFTTFYLYFIIALFESSRGNFVPFFIEEFKIDNATISLILSFNTLGMILGSFSAGRLCERYSHKFVYILGSVVSAIAVLIAPFTPNIYVLILFNLLFGFGRSLLCVAIDSLIPVLSFGFEVILMNITHFMYGVGSFAGQSIYGMLLSNDISWRSIYLYLAGFYIVSVVFTLIIKTPNMNVIQSNNIVIRKSLYKNYLIYLFVAAVTFQLISEQIINTWFISYIRSNYEYNPSDASFYASMFFLLFALGRLFGGFIINKVGTVRGIKVFMILFSLCVLLGLMLKENGLILISISGFFISIGFPTLMVLVSQTFNKNASFAIGLITTISNILFVIIFNITGLLNDIFGSYIAFFVAPISMIGSVIIITIISKKNTKKCL